MCKQIVDYEVVCAKTMVWAVCVDRSSILRQFALGFFQKHKDASMKSRRGYSRGFLSPPKVDASIARENV